MFKLAISVSVSFLMLNSAYGVMNAYKERAEQQRVQNLTITSLKDAWVSLAPTQEYWDKSFKPDHTAKDLNDIYNHIHVETYNMKPQSLALRDSGREIIKYNGQNIGLSKSCIANSSEGFALKESFVSHYVNNLRPLLTRQDISFNKVTMLVNSQLGDSTPYVHFDKLCIIMKGEDVFSGGAL